MKELHLKTQSDADESQGTCQEHVVVIFTTKSKERNYMFLKSKLSLILGQLQPRKIIVDCPVSVFLVASQVKLIYVAHRFKSSFTESHTNDFVIYHRGVLKGTYYAFFQSLDFLFGFFLVNLNHVKRSAGSDLSRLYVTHCLHRGSFTFHCEDVNIFRYKGNHNGIYIEICLVKGKTSEISV